MKRGKATFRKLVAAGLAVAALLLAGVAANAAAAGPRLPADTTVSPGRPAGPGPGRARQWLRSRGTGGFFLARPGRRHDRQRSGAGRGPNARPAGVYLRRHHDHVSLGGDR